MPEEFKLFLPIRRRKSIRDPRIGKASAHKVQNAERLAEEPPPFSEGGEGEGAEVEATVEAKDPSSNYNLKTNPASVAVTEKENPGRLSSSEEGGLGGSGPAGETVDDEEEENAILKGDGDEEEERNETDQEAEDQLQTQTTIEEVDEVEVDSSVGEEG